MVMRQLTWQRDTGVKTQRFCCFGITFHNWKIFSSFIRGVIALQSMIEVFCTMRLRRHIIPCQRSFTNNENCGLYYGTISKQLEIYTHTWSQVWKAQPTVTVRSNSVTLWPTPAVGCHSQRCQWTLWRIPYTYPCAFFQSSGGVTYVPVAYALVRIIDLQFRINLFNMI